MLIATEGVKTEVQYFEGLAQHLRATGVSIRSVTPKGVGKDPIRVVDAAVGWWQSDEYDEVWAVVDVDEHATLEKALLKAKRARLPVAVSNPCFEVWLIWHYEDCTAHHSTKEALARLEKLGHTDKGLPASFPYGNYAEASRRAGSTPAPCECGDNPSSAVPRLVRAVGTP